MREIKFRFWNKFDCKMIEFDFDDVYGGKIEFGALNFRLESDYVMQFTGLKDVNGVEIYEGDIVQFKEGTRLDNAEVNYSDIHGFWWANNCQGIDFMSCEVIGNIHENPELIKE